MLPHRVAVLDLLLEVRSEKALLFVQNAFSTGARMMPTESYHSVSQAVMMFIGDAVLDLLLDNSIPAYNLYAVHRLKNDVQKLRAFAEASGIPHMAVSLLHHDSLLCYVSIRFPSYNMYAM